jgi:hypothetical protein
MSLNVNLKLFNNKQITNFLLFLFKRWSDDSL